MERRNLFAAIGVLTTIIAITFLFNFNNQSVIAQGTTSDGITFTDISIGVTHSCALFPDHTVVCWGSNHFGEATPPDDTFQAISAGDNRTCGLKSNGSVMCWGRDADIAPPAGQFKAISTWDNTCAINSQDKILCWNRGILSFIYSADMFKAIDVGSEHSCAIKVDGNVVCWGRNDQGQANPPAGTFLSVSAGGAQTCAVNTDLKIICWGAGWDGPNDLLDTIFQSVVTSWTHSCGVKTDQTVACWGDTGPGDLTPPTGIFQKVGVGEWYSCGLRVSGAVECWGWNPDGRTSTPQFIMNLSVSRWDTITASSAPVEWQNALETTRTAKPMLQTQLCAKSALALFILAASKKMQPFSAGGEITIRQSKLRQELS